ncbi:MAG TPA: GNAT family N-acetyltransferase [Steroidobacteraceae bacterium]|nr:GNAT family N-acetyltransferase [Steroidobacteraceae bacterium]
MTGASAVEVIPVDARGGVARACLDHYFDELTARFPEGFDRETDSATALDDYRPPAGAFLVAQISGEGVGCGALRLFSQGIGEIKRMWVAPQVRGRGVARKRLGALERAAAERHLHTVRLDTHASLAAALQLYRTSGYQAIPRFNDNPYAHHWFEKTLD